MSDDIDENVGPATQLAPETDPEILLYDYSKYLLTLAMLILGGMLSIMQGADAQIRPPAPVLIGTLGPVAASGVMSLTCLSKIVRARVTGMPQTGAAIYNRLAMGLLGMGVGGFLVAWVTSIT